LLRLKRIAPITALLALVMLVQSAFAAEPITVRIMDLEERPGVVEITVSALDIKSRPLAGLTADNFKISLGDAQLSIKELLDPDAARQPSSVLLVVDVSGSMAGEPINQARNAMRDFVQTLEPTDYVGIVAFSSAVANLQPFTTDRDQLSAAIASLQASGETALYDAMLAASGQMAQAPTRRQLVVLLSDGRATIGLPNRDASIQAAVAADAGVVAVGLGADLDTQYLNELAKATNGRYLAAPTPASLRQAYQDLAYAIRSQYTLLVEVPPSIDRTVPGILRVHATYWSDTSFAERELAPLAGATKPPFNMRLDGIEAAQKISESVALNPSAPGGVKLVRAEYMVDGTIVHTAEGENLGFEFDPSTLTPGNHVITVQATDEGGNPGRADVPIIVSPPPASSGGFSLPLIPIVMLLVIGVIAWMLFKLFKKQRDVEPVLVSNRAAAWESRIPKRDTRLDKGALPETDEEEPAVPRRPAPARPVVTKPRGRIVIMNENAIRGGQLDAIQEYEIFNTPLTFGTGAAADMHVEDATGQIAAEEARIWVQRGRLVYHKLTTLSAMATEGVTSGWEFLEDGEELRIGVYRLVFQVFPDDVVASKVLDDRPTGLPQEHGMEIRHAWEGAGDYHSTPQNSDGSLDADAGADPSNREEALHDRTAYEDEGDYRSA
jgi:VWFA-related protein